MVCCAPAADIATRSSLHHQREEVSQICVAFSQDLALKLSHSSSLCSQARRSGQHYYPGRSWQRCQRKLFGYCHTLWFSLTRPWLLTLPLALALALALTLALALGSFLALASALALEDLLLRLCLLLLLLLHSYLRSRPPAHQNHPIPPPRRRAARWKAEPPRCQSQAHRNCRSSSGMAMLLTGLRGS